MVTLDDKDRARTDAEASAWLARLQSDERTPQTEAAFQDWLQSSSDNSPAFERATEIWEMLPGAVATGWAPANDAAPVSGKGFGMGKIAAVAAGIAMIIAASSYFLAARPIVYETSKGQQQIMTLADGSRVSLNTDSKISVAYFSGKRHVSLERGEVLFDVAHDPSRPFLVVAGNEQVRALGTSFVVRREPAAVTVTLIKGKVEIGGHASPADGDRFDPQIVLAPGERASFDAQAHLVLDRPAITALTAWRHGEVVFSNATLLEAANELNRYGPVKILVTGPAAAAVRVSGIFETSNAAEFANAMAQLNGLHLRRSGQTIELTL